MSEHAETLRKWAQQFEDIGVGPPWNRSELAAPLDDDWKIPFRRMMQIECMCGDVFDNIEAFIEHGRMAHDICECPEERLSQATVYGLSEASENTCARCGLSFAPAPPEPHREQE